MTDTEPLGVDKLNDQPPITMDGLDPSGERVWPHAPTGRSTAEAYYLPDAVTDTPVFQMSTTPGTEPGNIHNGAPHFARTVEDQPELGTVCGQCGQSWPCASWQELTRPDMMGVPAALLGETGGVGLADQERAKLEAVASAYNLTVDEVRTRLTGG